MLLNSSSSLSRVINSRQGFKPGQSAQVDAAFSLLASGQCASKKQPCLDFYGWSRRESAFLALNCQIGKVRRLARLLGAVLPLAGRSGQTGRDETPCFLALACWLHPAYLGHPQPPLAVAALSFLVGLLPSTWLLIRRRSMVGL